MREIKRKELNKLADEIVGSLAEKRLTLKEARMVLNIVDGKIRNILGVLTGRYDKVALKEMLKEAYDFKSSDKQTAFCEKAVCVDKIAEMKTEDFRRLHLEYSKSPPRSKL